ncbi:hypothetical protein GCM10011415_17000 [Salipiger pallidus]|uniref:Pyrroline-5-carboxylate reductase catalytic N-terminal domain-containing protein n=1 Tax=Salipiger pallidus TaxID=1775170 RepID=A0A8J2ZJB2_9RHOB|nr:NAD(P)-binding domain-containing protein [Salipiger pallidus]GGG70054.1 hypothetical protein GCM10011415_17000 [Salipiger pallidus]
MATIGFIGCGTIASAVVEGLAPDGHRILVTPRSKAHASRLAAAHENVEIAEAAAIVAACDVVFLGLMAEHAPGILGGLPFREGQNVISFMAGAGLGDVAALVAPARAAAVMMPFPGIATGGTPLMMLGDEALVGDLFGAKNTLFPLKDEAELSAYLSAQAVLSPAARMVADAADWLGDKVEDTAQGEAFLRMLVASSLAGSDCTTLIAALNTEGGYNQRLRVHMEDSGMGDALKSGLDAL